MNTSPPTTATVTIDAFYEMSPDERLKTIDSYRAGRSDVQCLVNIFGSLPENTKSFHMRKNEAVFTIEGGKSYEINPSLEQTHELRLAGLLDCWGRDLDGAENSKRRERSRLTEAIANGLNGLSREQRHEAVMLFRGGRNNRQCLVDILGSEWAPKRAKLFHVRENKGVFWMSDGTYRGTTLKIDLTAHQIHELQSAGLFSTWNAEIEEYSEAAPTQSSVKAIDSVKSNDRTRGDSIDLPWPVTDDLSLDQKALAYGAVYAPAYELNGKTEPGQYSMTFEQLYRIVTICQVQAIALVNSESFKDAALRFDRAAVKADSAKINYRFHFNNLER